MKRIALSLTILSLAGGSAHAFCGFFVAGSGTKLTNPASQVAIVRQGNRTTMSLSNAYQGPAENFAMVVPVPVVLAEKDVKTLEMSVFDHIDALSAPRLVEYWEQDPCEIRPMRRKGMKNKKSLRDTEKEEDGAPNDKDLGVKIEAKFAVGEYQILILSAKDSGGLDQWLRLNHYTIPDGAAGALAPYVADKMKFFVAKVDIKKVKRNAEGLLQLSPLRVTYESPEVRLPVRLGLLNAGAKQDLLVYFLAPNSRYEVANYPNLFVPTNLEVVDEVRKDFSSFYAELFDAALAPRQNKAVVTEYAWQTTSCDPCPTPPLGDAEIEILGADLGRGVVDDIGPSNTRRRGGYNVGSGWVLTRMHARYDKTSLTDDSIFKEAPPVMGGRSNFDGQSADAGATVMTGGSNNFQGRYIIRHYWTGAVKCQSPQYGQWGGPPHGNEPDEDGRRAAQAARGLALAPRGRVKLSKVVRSPVPTLGLPGHAPPRRRPSQTAPQQ